MDVGTKRAGRLQRGPANKGPAARNAGIMPKRRMYQHHALRRGIAQPDIERREALLMLWVAFAVSLVEALVASFERALRGCYQLKTLALLFVDL